MIFCKYNFDCIHRIESNTIATYLNIPQNKDKMKFTDRYYVICFSMIINISVQKLLDSFVTRFTGKRIRQCVYLRSLERMIQLIKKIIFNVFV